MVIGCGLMASAFIGDYVSDNNFIIFASGVSNSHETNISEFKREENLLIKTLLKNEDKHIVYFSTFNDSNIEKRKYIEHKLNMEMLIKNSKSNYTILKLPQVVGYGGNKHTLVNFIVNKIKNNEEINVYENTYKSLIDVEDIKRIVDVLLKQWKDKNMCVEIPFVEKLQVFEIVNLIMKQLNVEAKMKFINSNINDFPELSFNAKKLFTQLDITPNGYTERVVKKYIK
jgi:nucleoside-diphosphate-sugar epimerase